MEAALQVDMDLVPCNEFARQSLANLLLKVDDNLEVKKKSAEYVAKFFPSILLDVARHLTEQATKAARDMSISDNPALVQSQLKPFHMFSLLLGKCPQITGLMYSYFENSSFQPFPEGLFKLNAVEQKVEYKQEGFDDFVVKDILQSYFRYLCFNPKWFSVVWNWSELARFITVHTNQDVRYLAACCLSIITRPTRFQHGSFLRDTIATQLENYQELIDLQIKHRAIYENTFRPCIGFRKELSMQFAKSMGESESGYSYCQDSITKVANILLLKRDISLEDDSDSILAQCKEVLRKYVPVSTLNDTISKIAYSLSVNKPCLLRGSSGSGKTAALDYIAAQTNRVNPPNYVKVQIGDQIDSKLLIGSYVCTEVPGQFEWQPGPLTRAMAYGSWIVFEDIDCAPSEVAQVIHSVIENGNLSCVACCPMKLDSPHPDFRIFFTQRTSHSQRSESLKIGSGFVERLCDIVDLPDLNDENLEEILCKRYGFMELSNMILKLFQVAQESMKEYGLIKQSRTLTLRDLFKLCDRISIRKLQIRDDKFAVADLEAIFLDASDCFLSSLPLQDLKKLATKLGQVINIPENEVERLIIKRKPELREESSSFRIGRVRLDSNERSTVSVMATRSTLAHTKTTLNLLESVAACIKNREPVLLVGETGVGKTSVIQYLASLSKTDLRVINLSQQSDSSDLLGGYKPVEMREVIAPIDIEFDRLFRKTFDAESNSVFLKHVGNCFNSRNWSVYLKLVCKLCTKAKVLQKNLHHECVSGWVLLHDKVRRLANRIESDDRSSSMALSFSEGTLLKAVKQGQWILLDEINLAEPDVLQCLLLILDSIKEKHVYLNNSGEGGGCITIHPNFRLFACMNPSTDVGKRDLASGTRGRFSEFFVDDITETSDLRLIIESYVKTCISKKQIEDIVSFYQEVRVRTNLLSDISGNPPVYSLRTLCRALTICSNNVCGAMDKSLFESLRITFLQQLNEASTLQVMSLIEQTVFDKNTTTRLKSYKIPRPKDDHQYVEVEGFWIQKSNEEPFTDKNYILTKSVCRNLQSLSRIIALGQRKLPILIQGNTSVGKTSLITYLAEKTGNKCYRINNHEHTDLQDYVGRYVLRESGELEFQEGLLVRAMRKGYWIILDELNLAPCELLEALNRVLDENRELFIPETRETVKAHSKFVLFATQNPPEEYAGRKLLSRAFRNRFVELHFDEIPGDELETILQLSKSMAPKHAKKIVSVMKELQILRRESGCFNGKDGFMTLRDLFRWGQRYANYKEAPNTNYDLVIAEMGLVLLEGRVRTINEADTVKNVIEKVFNLKMSRDDIYNSVNTAFNVSTLSPKFKHIHFTKEFQKLFVQLSTALKNGEPVLLCGQTGCGKTTACQVSAEFKKQKLITYNCHLNSESADFVGGVRPSRSEQVLEDEIRARQTFPWVDGPLVEAMKIGALFLMDEISLADDAVLERINSLLEPTRSITLTEKDGEEIFAKDSFRIVATMNPGGDYGKKELSPALRNRFTEIYCHNTTDVDQIRGIIESCLSPNLLRPHIASKLLTIMQKFLKDYYRDGTSISLRDVVNWVYFLNKMLNASQPLPLSVQEAILHGASLIYFDQFKTCGHNTFDPSSIDEQKVRLKRNLKKSVNDNFGTEPIYANHSPEILEINHDIVKFGKFLISKGPMPIYKSIKREFILNTPTVRKNILKIVRAMQLDRPILLEGDPGAGKTSAISAMAKLTGHKLVRINLSEQTDISDLFGSDLPDTECRDDLPRFCWHDGPLLKAIKESNWVLLDEMNLASQSVLEGLNACFDHRGEIYIPELNKRVTVNRSKTRIFACQNPYNQGAARKGLPQSFLNRFTSIYIDSHTPQDLCRIIKNLYPILPNDIINKMVEFNTEVSQIDRFSLYEFNLRDLLYWCDLLTRYVLDTKFKDLNLIRPDRFVQFVYLDRLRSNIQKNAMADIFERHFDNPVYEPPYRELKLGERSFILGRSILNRNLRLPPSLSDLCILKYQMPYLESIAKAFEYNKMPILVGESGVGKRSMIRILAGLTGNELNFIGANRDMDTVELLGSFEQKSIQREIVELVEESKDCVTSIINSITKKEYASTWQQLFHHIWLALYATCIRDFKLSNTEMMDAYRVQLVQMKELLDNIKPLCDNLTDKRKKLTSKIDKLIKRSFQSSEALFSSGNFEWIDSILVKSIKEGKWLVIENANLMNPATLDRLNSLVETNGSLSLNEKGSGSEGIETLVPHPHFRLILTMNPEHGELSRAMRNRGVEISVQTRYYNEDFMMLLNQHGIEPEEEKICMTYCVMKTSYETHQKITSEEPEEEGSLLAYFGLNYISSLTNQVRRGLDVDQVLVNLLLVYYSQKGFVEEGEETMLRDYILDRMSQNRKKYEVRLNDERYKWRNLRHDLVSLTGGDALPAMVERDNRIFYEDFNIDELLGPEEMVENIDIVNTCTTVKIFLELSSHDDFDYRKGFIRETFSDYQNMMNIVNNHVDLLHRENIPLINRLSPRTDTLPIGDLYIDTRNAADIHYHLQSLDYTGTLEREGLQNRWLLSLHRIMLCMIVELIEDRTQGDVSLWVQSERVRAGSLLKEQLIRPVAEIASDLYDLLTGILRVVSNRCFNDMTVAKMLPRLFWIHYFLCKLKKGQCKGDLIAVCNQIPMLWALTYQKVIEPIIQECEMADLSYKNKKFSHRIQHICDFLDTPMTKPGISEKENYKKIVNRHATLPKICEVISREVDKFFNLLVGRCTNRSQALSLGSDNTDTLATSSCMLSNSNYLQAFYNLQDKLLLVDLSSRVGCTRGNIDPKNLEVRTVQEEAQVVIKLMKKSYETHESDLENKTRENYKFRYLDENRRKNALDQFAPIWQLEFVKTRFSDLTPSVVDPKHQRDLLRQILDHVNGIILSPKYYGTLIKFLQVLGERNEKQQSSTDRVLDTFENFKEDVDLYTTFLVDHLLENVVLDHQIVRWTKLRVTTSDFSPMAPMMPEYSPLLSLVGSYCLDIQHLKLNSYLHSTNQLKSLVHHLWINYALIKLQARQDDHDIKLAKNLAHMRQKLLDQEELIDTRICTGNKECLCLDEQVKLKVPSYQEALENIKTKMSPEDSIHVQKALQLIYYGYLNYTEYTPTFTIDPSLRSREKLDVYISELAHLKLDLHLRNTLFYWKTGENLQLNDISDSDEALLYPLSTRIQIDRRIKLEKSINKLRNEYTNRPRSDDGSIYYELRKDIEVHSQRFSSYIASFTHDLNEYVGCDSQAKARRFENLITKCRVLIKNLQKSIIRFRSEYMLYSEITTNFLVGLCFVLQGFRLLYSRFEQQLQITALGFKPSVQNYEKIIMRAFSFNDFTSGSLESVHRKLQLLRVLDRLCTEDSVSNLQSTILRTVLMQLNHHIIITPSDIKKCMPIVRDIADRFHAAWLKRKLNLEKQRAREEELYQYKERAFSTQVSYERQEFLDICSKFPLYDHLYKDYMRIELTSADQENLKTEENVIILNKIGDLSMCIDICKAHYKFTKEASLSLLGQVDSRESHITPIDLSKVIKLEAETLYAITRHCIPTLSPSFDALSLECHLLQAHQLHKSLNKKAERAAQTGSLKSSIEILDEEVFNIYHDANAPEALKFQDFIAKLSGIILQLQNNTDKKYEGNTSLQTILRILSRISSFLISEPFMKFVTGSHVVLEKIEEWNRQTIPREDKFIGEQEDLISLIKSWRSLEVESWKNTLHIVKRKYIDDTLCDLWFTLYEAFNNPIVWVRNLLRDNLGNDEFNFSSEHERLFYEGFAFFIKEFFEGASLGDYQIRLDLVFSFAMQTRFASLYEQAQPNYINSLLPEEKYMKVDFEKLTTYVYNTHRQYQGLLEPLKDSLTQLESQLTQELNTETRIVAWSNRNLWDMKNNFRKSHKKLNKVMNKYLEVLRRPLHGIIGTQQVAPMSNATPAITTDASDRVCMTLAAIQTLMENVEPAQMHLLELDSLRNSITTVQKLKELYGAIYEPMTNRYVDKIVSLEQVMKNSADAIQNFYSHKVSNVVIDPKDSKETTASKHKQCREMHHSKKFALQSIFKDLQALGVSYQRGLNSQETLDRQILSLEPLRGMIRNQSKLVLKAASELVDDDIITACNDQYRKLIASNMNLLARSNDGELDTDHLQRIHGIALDFVHDIIQHNRNAAIIYRHLMDIQAATTRLRQLQKFSKADRIVIYHFDKIQRTIRQFNELVGRAHLAISKLEKLVECCSFVIETDSLECDNPNSVPRNEEHVIRQLMSVLSDKNALMTRDQLNHIKSHMSHIRTTVSSVSHELRDMLNHTAKNYIYSNDDIEHLESLYHRFSEAFSNILMQESNCQQTPSTQPCTVLGSIQALLNETTLELKQNIDNCVALVRSRRVAELHKHSKADKLNLRINKLVRQVKIATQDVYKEERTEKDNLSKSLSESAKRKRRPFNYIDSSKIQQLLRLSQVSRLVGNCFMTLNNEKTSIDVKPLVVGLEPILFIYTLDVASYLNIILTSLHLKLAAANQLLPFFTDLVLNGFGLPYKVESDHGTDGKQAKSSEENSGFGEGQGDTDVSKKLEFESELDEIQKKGDPDEKNETETKDIDAHDDGVEMSENIEAKAEGQDQKDQDQNGDDPDDEEDKQDLEELDKELDKVDNDEGQLDENLWDDKDEPLGDDDEEDLRQTDPESGSKKDMDDEQLLAKNEDLTSGAKKDDEIGNKENTDDTEQTNDEAQGKEKEEAEDKETCDNNIDKVPDQHENEADLDQEAAEALQCTETAEEREDAAVEPEDGTIDMSMDSDDGEVEPEEKSDEKTDGTKEEGEIDDLESDGDKEIEEIKEDGEEGANSQSVLDDALIDHRLEVAIHPELADQLPNPVEDAIRNAASSAKENDENSPKQEMQGQKVGPHTLYDIIPEEDDDDPLDLNENDRNEERTTENEPPEQTQEQSTPSQKKSNTDSCVGDDLMDVSDSKEDRKEDNQEVVDKSSKRTHADQDENDEKLKPKRQKILEAKDKSEEGSSDSKVDEPRSDTRSQSVRHIEKDTSAYEVIDLVSSSDEECVDDNKKNADLEGDLTLEPKDTPTEIKKEITHHDKPVENIDEEKQEDNIAQDDLSSISSLESGQLIVDSPPRMNNDIDSSERGPNSSYNTNLGLLKYISLPNTKEQAVTDDKLIEEIDKELNRKSTKEHDSVHVDRLTSLWLDCTRRTGRLVQELCQQLQIVLQPTKMSKYKGDYKSGKRLNMRKIISYIASHYRKDKIWLRRTKPSKRTYNITIAVDNSSSMSENNCRQMTYQSLALLAKSLSLIEAGSLSVVSFGQQVKCIHEFGQPYVDAIGAHWLRELRFDESRTSYTQLLKHCHKSFSRQAQQSQLNTPTSQLLIILSDGRNISSEEEEVKSYLRQLKSTGVLTLFIIIDDLMSNGDKSIVDVKRCTGFGSSIKMVNYMEFFPFPFYVLLRNIDSMPSILGDALRQWFELVSNV